MKELIMSLILSEKIRKQRFSEFYEFLKETITTIPPQVLSKVDSLKASKYMYALLGFLILNIGSLILISRI